MEVCLPLIGRNALQMFNVGFTKVPKVGGNNLFINQESNVIGDAVTKKLTNILQTYREVFDRKIGTFNRFEVSLYLKKGVTPKFFKAGPVPLALKTQIEQELPPLVDNSILVKTEFSEWATPLYPS